MTKNRNSQTIVLETKKTRDSGTISGWIWPYVIIPAIVAALLAVFFFILGPLLMNWIGVKHGLEFWLITLALWGVATVLATLLWIYAKNHLIKKQYHTVSRYDIEKSYVCEKDQIEGIEGKVDKYRPKKSEYDEIDTSYRDQRVIEQNYDRKEQSPSPSDSADEQHKSDVQKGIPDSLDVNYREEDSQTYVIKVDEPKTGNLSSENQHLNPDSENCHPPRRVSYAGIISVDIPLQEKKTDDEESSHKTHALRPPTPRFPRNMRVASNDSSIYTEFVTLYPNYKKQKVSFSDNPESSAKLHSEPEKEVHLEKVQIQEVSIVHGKVNGTASEDNGTQHLPVQHMTMDTKNSTNSVSNKEEDEKKETHLVKKIRLSEEFDKENDIVNGKDRYKRMSLDRNQFLGWNPDEGVLAEADPGSKEREQMRWSRSLGRWHTSTSMPWNDEVPREQENSDEEEVDDVFQDDVMIVPRVHKIETQVTRTVMISQKAQKVNLEDDEK